MAQKPGDTKTRKSSVPKAYNNQTLSLQISKKKQDNKTKQVQKQVKTSKNAHKLHANQKNKVAEL